MRQEHKTVRIDDDAMELLNELVEHYTIKASRPVSKTAVASQIIRKAHNAFKTKQINKEG